MTKADRMSEFLEAVDAVATAATELRFRGATYQRLPNGDEAFTEEAQDYYNEAHDSVANALCEKGDYTVRDEHGYID